jgi:YVTN family beta-propeller protein
VTTDPRVGTLFGDYLIGSLLGQGGMATVYLAEDLRDGRNVALKILSSDLARDERFRDRFVRESQLAESLHHRNVVPVIEAGERDGQLYITMAYVAGSDLKTLIERDGPLPPERAAAILDQVASALDAAHEEGLVHRDVKPANVLVTPQDGGDHAFLADFGLVKRAESGTGLTRTGQFMGSVDYVAPEQIRGEKVDARSDIYSLACLLYECLTAERPYPREAEVAVMWAHVQEDAPTVRDKRSDLPPTVDHVLARAMAKDPSERFASAGELARVFRDALEGRPVPPPPGAEPIEPPPEGFIPRVRWRTRRAVRWTLASRARTAVAIVVVLALVAAGPAVVVLLRPEPIDLAALQDAVARIDPASGKLAAGFRVSESPSAVTVAGDGSLWVASRSGSVSKLDPDTGSTLATASVNNASALAFGEGSIWALGGAATSSLTPIDPSTGKRGTAIDLGALSEDVAVGEGAAWATDVNDGMLLRVDPKTKAVSQHIDVGGQPTGVAVGQGAVWVTVSSGSDNEVARVDPKSFAVTERIALPSRPDSVAAGPEGVWVANGDDDSVSRIDPTGRRVSATVKVGRLPTDVAVGGGAVWVANHRSNTLSSVDPGTRAVRTIPLGVSPTSVVVSGSGVWASTYPDRPLFSKASCAPIPISEPVDCGFVTVPERHTDPFGRSIRIWVGQRHILPKEEDKAGVKPPDRVLVPTTELGQHIRYEDVGPLGPRTGREVVWFDLRGAGSSTPSLACPEVDRAGATLAPLRLRDPKYRSTFLGAVRHCHDRLLEEHIDLGAYTVREAAADAEDVRLALGIQQVDLRTLGYAGRVGWEMMRQFPQTVRAAWFDSPEYPEADYFAQAITGTRQALARLAELCSGNAPCRSHFPDLEGTFNRAVSQLNTNPANVAANPSERGTTVTHRRVTVAIDGDLFLRAIRHDLSSNPNVQLAPGHIYAGVKRAFGSSPESLAYGTAARSPLCGGYRPLCLDFVFSHGAAYSVLCHDEVPFTTRAKLEGLAGGNDAYTDDFVDNPYFDVCKIWDVGRANASERTPVKSDIPVLIFHGDLDPYYPASEAKRGTSGLQHVREYTFPGFGFNILGNGCAITIRNQWVRNPSVEPDTTCINDLPKPTINAGFSTEARF